jgi:hypothetical protein
MIVDVIIVLAVDVIIVVAVDVTTVEKLDFILVIDDCSINMFISFVILYKNED